MKNCIAIQCPFVWYCNKFNRDEDRTDGCETQNRIMEAASLLSKRHRAEANAAREKGEANGQAVD